MMTLVLKDEQNKARRIAKNLETWFAQVGRKLVFRETRDPYAVWISETMLQQTTTAAAEGFYRRFLQRFPEATALAEAPTDEVLAYWAGLGYYRRAHNLHKAAKIIASRYGGKLPATHKELMDLPGIGRYTAGAIASIAYGMHTPIVEANSQRVIARLFMISESLPEMWVKAELLIKHSKDPRAFNLALMDLGADICGKIPKCEICPIRKDCAAFINNVQTEYPRTKPRRESVLLDRDCFTVNYRDKWLVRLIPEGEWHHGMYEFPSFNRNADSNMYGLFKQLSTDLGAYRFLMVKYVVTHHKITMDVWKMEAKTPVKVPEGMSWKSLGEISALPMGSAQRKIAQKLLTQTTDLLGHVT